MLNEKTMEWNLLNLYFDFLEEKHDQSEYIVFGIFYHNIFRIYRDHHTPAYFLLKCCNRESSVTVSL